MNEWVNNLQENAVGFTVYYRVFLWQIDGEKVEAVTGFMFLSFKFTVDSDCTHETKRHSLEGKLWPI